MVTTDVVSADANVDVCICTYRRSSVVDTLRSIAMQRPPRSLRVIVADNDDTPSAQTLVVSTCAELGLRVHYVHAPARNISVARNAALDAVTAPYALFIDDDEIAHPGWIEALLQRQHETDAMIVFGPVNAIYANGPSWLGKADLHSIRPVFRAGDVIDTGYTCNVLMHRAAMTDDMRACRFDPALGRSGGEDTFFFHSLHTLGAPMRFTEAAVVEEEVPPHRGRMPWLLKRSFRAGQTHARVLLTRPGGRLQKIGVASAKCTYCIGSMLLGAASPPKWRRGAVRAALHAGVVTRLAGIGDIELY